MGQEFWLSDEQWAVIAPLLPTNGAGVRRVDDRRVISGITHVLKSGCRWQDCPVVYGRLPPSTIVSTAGRASISGIACWRLWSRWMALRSVSFGRFVGLGPSLRRLGSDIAGLEVLVSRQDVALSNSSDRHPDLCAIANLTAFPGHGNGVAIGTGEDVELAEQPAAGSEHQSGAWQANFARKSASSAGIG